MGNKILIIQTAFIGDVILATSIIEGIHKNKPDSKLHFLLRKGNENLLKGHPHIDKLWIWDKKKAKYPELLRLIRSIRDEHYNKVINLQRFASTGILTACSGAQETRGFKKNPFSFLFNIKGDHQIGTGTHEIERNQVLIADFAGSNAIRPKLFPSEEDFEKVKPLKKNRFITLSPTSVWFTKQYPADRWMELAKAIPADYTIYILGGPGDKSACDKIAEEASNNNCIVLAGQLSLLQSAALMKDARMNFVNDSAPLHLCSAMNAPVRAIFCSTIPEFGFGPLSEQSEIIQAEEKLDCRPCGLHGLRECKKKTFDCAYNIPLKKLSAGL